MPDLNLPPRLNGEIERLSSETRTVVIIGANGAGKSRFTRSLAANLGDSAFRLNALDALYSVTVSDPGHNPVDRLHEQVNDLITNHSVPLHDLFRERIAAD